MGRFVQWLKEVYASTLSLVNAGLKIFYGCYELQLATGS
jgi:hypothetical protein